MQLPTPTLSYMLAVHGLFGGFVELFDYSAKRLALPIMHFANSSIHKRFGISLTSSQSNSVYLAMTSLAMIGTIIGMFVVAPVVERWGRRYTAVYLRAAIATTAIALVLVSRWTDGIELLFAGFFAYGIADAIRLSASKIYLTECAPNNMRAFAIEVCTTIGGFESGLFAFLLVSNFFGNDQAFHYAFVVVLGQCLIFVALAGWIPESPKFLHVQGVSRDKVANVVRKFHGEDTDVDSILSEYRVEERVAGHVPITSILADPFLRRCFALTVAPLLMTHFCAYTVINANGVVLMVRFGWTHTSVVASLGVLSLAMLPFSVLRPILYERVGRRGIILTSMVLGFIAIALYAAAQVIVDLNDGPTAVSWYLSAGTLVLYHTALALGIAGAYMVIAMDIASVNVKLTLMQIVLLARCLLPIASNLYFMALDSISGAWMYVPLLILEVACIRYIWIYMPETKGHSVAANIQKMQSKMTDEKDKPAQVGLLPNGNDIDTQPLKSEA